MNIYTPNVNAPNFRKQILLYTEDQVPNNTVIMEDLNTLLSQLDKKIYKETPDLNYTFNQT